MRRKWGSGILVLMLVSLAVLAGLSGTALTGSRLSLANPSSPIVFNPFGMAYSYSTNVQAKGSIVNQVSACKPDQSLVVCIGSRSAGSLPYSTTVSDSTMNTPIGIADGGFIIQWNQGGVGGVKNSAFVVKMPGDLADGCTSLTADGCSPTGSYGATISHGDLRILDDTTPQWQYDACPSNPCVQTFTRNIVVGNQSGTQTFYVTRMYTNLFLSVTSSISIACVTPDSSYICPTQSTQSQFCIPLIGCAGGSLDDALKVGANDILSSVVNPTGLLKAPSRIALQVNVPAIALTSPQDWFGVYGVWIGSNENMAGGCNSNFCTTGLTAHAALGVYSDSLLTVGAQSVVAQYPLLSQYSLSQMLQLTPSSAKPTVYTAVPVKSFGFQYSLSNTCSISSLNTCFSSSQSGSLNIPLIIDVIGSKTVLLPSSPAPSSLAGGYVDGKILDGGSLLCGVGLCGPLPGVTVTDGPICSSPGCVQVTTQSQPDGSYSIGELTNGAHSLWYYQPSYQPVTQTVQAVQGIHVKAPAVTMQPTTPSGTVCIIGPVNNPLPGQPPIFAGICPPVWEVVLVFVIAAGLLALTIFLIVPSRRKLTVRAGRIGVGF